MSLPQISASVMACDLTRLGDELRAMDAAGIDAFHWDIMDGHFVRNLTFGPDLMAQARGQTKTFFDVHIMARRPEDWIDIFATAGADAITVHAEAVHDIGDALALIRKHNIQTGLALNPGTELTVIADHLEKIDRLLVMTVEPGFGGQAHLRMDDKIATARRVAPDLPITVDGGINADTAPAAVAAGATTLVSGSYLFKQADYRAAIQTLRRAA